jgi:MFS family permease
MAFNDFFRILHNKRALKLFLPISTAYFFFAFGWGLTTPIFSIFINNVTGDLFLTGVILGLWGIVGLFSDVPFGVLIDKVSPKKLIQISLAAYLLITIGYTFATNFPMLFFVRVMHSFFGALMWVAIWAYLYSKIEQKKAAQEIGLFSEFYDVAATASPLLGGLLVAVSFFTPFYLLSIFCFIAFMVITLFMPEQKNHKTHDGYFGLMKKEVFDIAKMGNVFYYLAIFLIIVFGVNNIVLGFLPIILNSVGVGYELIGLIIAATTLPAVLLEVPIGGFIDKVGRNKAAVVGLGISALCTAILSFTLYVPVVIGTMFLFGISTVMLVLLSNAAASDFTPKMGRGCFSGIVTFFKDVGNFVGPILGGVALKFAGEPKTMLAIAIILAASALPMYLMFGKKRGITDVKLS